jgi:hypothetical protein
LIFMNNIELYHIEMISQRRRGLMQFKEKIRWLL